MSLKHFIASAAVLLTLTGTVMAVEDTPLQAMLAEGKSSGKGLAFHVNGQTIAGVVVSFDERFVVARSTANGFIVIRRERIDAVSGHVALANGGAAK